MLVYNLTPGATLLTDTHDTGLVIVIPNCIIKNITNDNATNLITEATIARNLETTFVEILKTIHPHPTLSEAIMEATADALDEAIHI